jgi:hypothetical protein
MQPPQPIIYGSRSTPRCRPARIVARRRPAASIAPAAGKNGSHAIISRSALLPVTLLRRSSTSSIQKSSAPCARCSTQSLSAIMAGARVERHRSLRRPFYHLHPGHLFVARPRLPDCRQRLISGNPGFPGGASSEEDAPGRVNFSSELNSSDGSTPILHAICFE